MGYQEGLRLKREADKFLYACDFNRAVTLLQESLALLHIGGSEGKEFQEKTRKCFSLETDIYVELAACLLEQKKYTECIECCETVLKVRPTCVKCCFRYAVATYSLGHHEAATPKFEKALKAVRQARLANRGQDIMLSEIKKSCKAYLKSMQYTSLEERSEFMKNFEDSLREDSEDSCWAQVVATDLPIQDDLSVQETDFFGEEVTDSTPFL